MYVHCFNIPFHLLFLFPLLSLGLLHPTHGEGREGRGRGGKGKGGEGREGEGRGGEEKGREGRGGEGRGGEGRGGEGSLCYHKVFERTFTNRVEHVTL